MIEYMLMNLGFVAATIGLKPEHLTDKVVPDDQQPPNPAPKKERPYVRQGLEGVTIAESFYSPIRRTDFL